jgi:hypothetical protein
MGIADHAPPWEKSLMRKIRDDVVMVFTNDDGPYKNTKPTQVQFGQHTVLARDWTTALQKICDKVAEENLDDIHDLLNKIGWTRRPYFTRGADNDYKRPYQVGNTDIYVECNLSANNTKDLIDGISWLFGYGKVKVELS